MCICHYYFCSIFFFPFVNQKVHRFCILLKTKSQTQKTQVFPLRKFHTQAGPNRFEFAHRSSQVYFGLVFGIVGLVVPIAIIASTIQKGKGNASLALAALFPIIFIGVFVFFCYRFKWSKMIIDFNSRQVTYIVASFPMILCQSPNQSASIDTLANLHIHDTGITNGGRGRNRGVPILQLQILVNGATENAIPIATVNGHFNASPIMNQWTVFLQSHGVTVANAAAQQLAAIMPMGGMMMPMIMAGQPVMIHSPTGSPTIIHHTGGSPQQYQFQQPQQYPGSPMNVYPGTQMTPTNNINNNMGYGAPPPPPPPPPVGAMPGFATYENTTAVPAQNYNYAPPPLQHY
jgi:hypothetical protein